MSPLDVDMDVVWAKERGLETPYPLLGHLLDTSAAMGELYHRWLRPGLHSLLVDELGEHVDKLIHISSNKTTNMGRPLRRFGKTSNGTGLRLVPIT